MVVCQSLIRTLHIYQQEGTVIIDFWIRGTEFEHLLIILKGFCILLLRSIEIAPIQVVFAKMGVQSDDGSVGGKCLFPFAQASVDLSPVIEQDGAMQAMLVLFQLVI